MRKKPRGRFVGFRLLLRDLGRNMFDIEDLKAPKFGVNPAYLVLTPFIGLVMDVYPHENEHVSGIGLKDNSAIGVVDANRPQIGVPGFLDLFVIDARTGGIGAELVHKLQHPVLPLFLYL